MQKKYKLIHEYPGSPKLNTVISQYISKMSPYDYRTNENGDWCEEAEQIENNPTYWQEIKEVKLEVPVGTKFVDRLGQLFTIKKIEDDCALIQWNTPNYMINRIQIEIINTAFKDGTWVIYKEKEFEILEWDYIPGRSGCNVCGERNEQYYANKKITKVKRLSDGVVFSVGDIINGYSYNSRKIEGFIIDARGKLSITQCYGHSWLKDINHSKQPLFLDELGNEVYEGDEIYYLCKDWSIQSNSASKYDGTNPIYKYFKNKVDAEKYITDNKPTFSRKQILDSYRQSKLTVSVFGTIIDEQRFYKNLGL